MSLEGAFPETPGQPRHIADLVEVALLRYDLAAAANHPDPAEREAARDRIRQARFPELYAQEGITARQRQQMLPCLADGWQPEPDCTRSSRRRRPR